jgi:integrator complex subunit 2
MLSDVSNGEDEESKRACCTVSQTPQPTIDLQRVPNPETADVATLKAYCEAWEDAFSKDPRSLALSMVNNLGCGGRRLSHADLVIDPSLVLRVRHPAVLREPLLVRILLRVLGMFLTAFRALLAEQGELQQQSKQRQDIATLGLAQESAIIQGILELCLEEHPALPSPKSAVALGDLRKLSCDFVHQRFLESPAVMRVVQFQGYNTKILPIAVRGIGSMWKCVDFIPELLDSPDIEKQLFALELVGHIASQWTVKNSLDMIGEVLRRFHNFHEMPASVAFLLRGVPHISLMCDAFPCIAGEADMLLGNIESSIAEAQGTDV